MNYSPKQQRGYLLLVDDNFHFMDEDERTCAGEYSGYEEALAHAKEIVESFFRDAATEATAEDLVDSYNSFGDDPFIVPFGGAPEPAERFSAWTYAKQVAANIVEKNREGLPVDVPPHGLKKEEP